MALARVLTKEQLEAERRRLKVLEAFKMVFGQNETTRTDYQRTVMADLRLMAYADKPVFQPDKAGNFCPIRAAVTDGRRSLFADIMANINFVPPSEDAKQ